MHPRLLKTFLAVARSRNITRAAREVHLAQSSVSDQIQTLEADLGTALFVRSRIGLDLTPAGRTLQPYAEELLMLADEARAAVQAGAGQVSGSLTIGALETIASTRLAHWLARFQASHPDIAFRLTVAGSGELLRKLGDGEIDVAFCFDRGDAFKRDERLARRTVSAEPLVLVGPPGQGPVREELAGLAAMNFVATEPGCVYRHMFDTAFTEAGLAAPKPACEVGSIGTIAGLVAAGAGFALVPHMAVAEALERGELIEMQWPGAARTVALAMIWRRRRVQPPALKLLLTAAGGSFTPVKPADARPRHAALSPS
jgi:DNA-binding transcriptional LysR family regulator